KRKIGEARRLTEIAVGNASDVSKPVAVFDGKAYSSAGVAKLVEKIAIGTGMSGSEVKKEIASRQRFISANKKTRGFEKSFSSIQKFMFGKGD
ncbi:MAG: hypothetical protein NTV88_01645, partial [Candidatus Micrarchaeota archaeon]|nr:hypothetical protein [Candidatus Micrarchaeota archaeon]